MPHVGSAWLFRADIEGLRAVAVLLVILYHAELEQLSGGFIGVDVFFVLSGFLITGLLRRELASTGSVDLRAFYARRIRRLLPASSLVLIATLLFSWYGLSPLDRPRMSADGVPTALYIANIHFASEQLDYLRADFVSPLLHYWSLAVEEQFYLVWPAFLLGVWSLFRATARTGFSLVLGLVTLASFAYAVTTTAHVQPHAFFLLPSRAWEFAIGGLLALHQHRLSGLNARVARVMGWCGLGALVLAATALDERTPYPGTAATLPVLATLLLLGAGVISPTTGVAAHLSRRPLQWIGRHSYSLYLWHWPLIAIGGGLSLGISSGRAVTAIALSFILSFLTFKYVEDPIRHGASLRASTARTFALGAALTGLGVVAALALSGSAGHHTSQSVTDFREIALADLLAEPTGFVPRNTEPPLLEARNDRPRLYQDGCFATFEDTDLLPCSYGAAGAEISIALLGDSHAAMWFPAFEHVARANEWSLTVLTKAACPAVDLSVFNLSLNRHYHECDTWREDAMERIAEVEPTLVVIANFNKGPDTGGVVNPDAWIDALERTIRRLPDSSRVLMLGDLPIAAEDPVSCLAQNLNAAAKCGVPVTADEKALAAREGELIERFGGTFLDVTAALCPTDTCPPVLANMLIYRDTHHLSATAARALAPLLESAVIDALERRRDEFVGV